MIVVSEVSHSYPTVSGSTPALADVSLEVRPGEILAVVGANGSGKSTLALACNGLVLPSAGRVEVDGMDTSDESLTWDVRSRVGLVLQDPDDQIVGTSVESDVAFAPENLGVPRAEIRERIDWALDVVGLRGLESREPHLLSEGQKQRLAIAGALAMRPAYLVLDEPTAMLDPRGRREVLDVVRRLVCEQGTGVLHVTHRLDELASAHRVAALEEGRIAYLGEPAGLLLDKQLMRACAITHPASWELAEELRRLGLPVPVGALDSVSILGALRC